MSCGVQNQKPDNPNKSLDTACAFWVHHTPRRRGVHETAAAPLASLLLTLTRHLRDIEFLSEVRLQPCDVPALAVRVVVILAPRLSVNSAQPSEELGTCPG